MGTDPELIFPFWWLTDICTHNTDTSKHQVPTCYNLLHFTDEETKAQGGQVAHPRSLREHVQNSNQSPRLHNLPSKWRALLPGGGAWGTCCSQQPAPPRNHLNPSTQFSLPQCPFKMQIDSLICLENTKAVPLQKCETRRFSEAGNTNSSTFVHSKQYGREEAGARVRTKHPMCYVWAVNIAQRLAKRIS